MKKIISIIFVFVGLALAFSACGGETYADKLKKEKKGIERFINDNRITTRGTYPADHKFAENEYYLDPNTGVYIRVIDPGDETRPVKGKTDVYLNYETILNLLNENDTVASNNFQGYLMTFKYGSPSTYTGNSTASTAATQMYYFLSPACVLPLEQGLGNKAEVSLIVPFASGSTEQQRSYIPFFYKRLIYNFIVDEPEATEE
ncbi:DUF4827 family protein [Prevotella sp. 10(H)]|uniref:DUF4827 family protein n=1 Tax=Prevotella sp. 10(H) TaxID=1158294 RepID=UPI0004A786F8|nr:DUF4827 family protein [Prevotella sp. 10(H)]